MTFVQEPRPLADDETGYETITATQRLPYLVAVDASSSAVVGYSNAHLFITREAYRFTVEISLFCDPNFTGRGVGSRLLESLLDVLRDPAAHPELAPPEARGDVKNVIALMAVDLSGKGGGLALKAFYERFGFEQVSILARYSSRPSSSYAAHRYCEQLGASTDPA